jgi:hypothetical protein
VLDLSTAAPSALAKALFTSEHSFLDLLAEGEGGSGESVTTRRTRAPASAGPAAGASLAPTPLGRTASEPASAGGPGGVAHSRTMDEDWFRHVHHSILGHGGDLRTSALSLYLPTTNGTAAASTTTAGAGTSASGAPAPPPLQATTSQGSSQASPRDSGVGDVSLQTSPSASPVRPPGPTSAAAPITVTAGVVAGDRGRAEREVSGLSSQGNRFYNSCWTIYVDSTVVKPNLESTLRWYALACALSLALAS